MDERTFVSKAERKANAAMKLLDALESKVGELQSKILELDRVYANATKLLEQRLSTLHERLENHASNRTAHEDGGE